MLSSMICIIHDDTFGLYDAALKFGRGNKAVVGMTSSEGESFTFRTVVPVEGPVESWMRGVEAEMRRTLAAVTKEGTYTFQPCAIRAC
jgi:dynein heavy chain